MPAVLRFGGLVFLGACWTATPSQPYSSPVQAIEIRTADISGSYWCSIDEDGYEYPRYPCMIKKVDGDFVLAKLAGSQRIRGLVRPNSRDGFTFSGEMYCPDGDCQQELHGTFRPMRGGYRGKFREESLVVNLTPASKGAFGGVDYGGDEAFNLDGVGGDGYGSPQYQIDSRGRRRP